MSSITRATCSAAIAAKIPIATQKPCTPEVFTGSSPAAAPSKATCSEVYMSLPW